MDEIDNIIIHSLRQIGCEFDEDITSLVKFSPELLVCSVSKCLTLIQPSLELPKSLPPGMAQRFGVTAALAEACTSVGFRGDIGYQTFLYSNVTEVRRVLMFLIERLPKEAEKSTLSQSIDSLTSREQEIAKNIALCLSSPWYPPVCKKPTATIQFKPSVLDIPFVTKSNDISPELRDYWFHSCPSVFQQTTSKTLFPSLIHKNDKDLFSSSITLDSDGIVDKLDKMLNLSSNTVSENQFPKIETSIIQQNQISDSDSTPMKEIQTESPIKILHKEIENLKKSIEDSLNHRIKLIEKTEELSRASSEMEKKLVILKSEKRVKERTQILLDNPEENVEKLEIMLATTIERMKKLSQQWEQHRTPLMEALNDAKEKHSKEFSKTKQIQDQITATRIKSEDIASTLKQKIVMQGHLTAELEKVNKNINRKAYTSRILEIIGNIRKQKNDIDKVLRDTKELQKEINSITGQLDRQFTVTDDLIYKTAKRDEYSRKAYKLLATLHADCGELVNYIQETGMITREVRDIEDQIENEKVRNVSVNLERITNDLQQMQKEREQLQNKLKSIKN